MKFCLYSDSPCTVTRTDEDGNVSTYPATWREASNLIHDHSTNPYAATTRFSNVGKVTVEATEGVLFVITRDPE